MRFTCSKRIAKTNNMQFLKPIYPTKLIEAYENKLVEEIAEAQKKLNRYIEVHAPQDELDFKCFLEAFKGVFDSGFKVILGSDHSRVISINRVRYNTTYYVQVFADPCRKEKEEYNDDTVCIICMDHVQDATLRPCGHSKYCKGCITKLVDKTCPECRKPINKVQ